MADDEVPGLSGDMMGPCGRAQRVDPAGRADARLAVDWWLLDIPGASPAWDQYVMACVRLDDVPGYPPAHLQFDGATHEVMVHALDPEHRVTAENAAGRYPGRAVFLLPVNVAEQFTATDEEMRTVCQYAARACVNGLMTPEPALSGSREWLQPFVKTLAHIRGEEHAP